MSLTSGRLVKFIFFFVVVVALCSVVFVLGAGVVVASSVASSVVVSFVWTGSVVLTGVHWTVGWTDSSVVFCVCVWVELSVSLAPFGGVTVELAGKGGPLVLEAGVALVKYMARPCLSVWRAAEESTTSVDGIVSVCGNAFASALPTGMREKGPLLGLSRQVLKT